MARLGKRERATKAAIVKGNLANMGNLERSSGTLGSRMHSTNLLRHTHTMGAHVGHNNKGSKGRAQATKRWGNS